MLMLEIAGGIILAVVFLIVVLAFLGQIILGLSAAFLIALIGGGIWLLATYTDALPIVLMIFVAGSAVAGFGYWTHVDTRFHRPIDPSERDQPHSR
jgi:hypothetical protein